MSEDEMIDKHNKMIMDIINQCNYIIENRKYLTDVGIKNTVSKIRDIVNYYYIKEPEKEYHQWDLEKLQDYHKENSELNTKCVQLEWQLEKKDKIIKLMIKHLCHVIDNDRDASLLPFYDSDDNLEEKVKKYFERKAEDE